MKKIAVSNKKNSYTTLVSLSKGQYEHSGSRFFAYAFPTTSVEEIKVKRQDLNRSHPKACHIVEAYRLKNGIYRANDDGEPSGSTGLPVLGQIDSFTLLDVAVLVVRYFGGTLLGVSGLIKAYKLSSRRALEKASFIEKDYVKLFTISCPYSQVNRLMLALKEAEGVVEAQSMAIESVLEVALPIKNVPFFQGRVRTLLEKKIITMREKK